jgi:hypothetical protein
VGAWQSLPPEPPQPEVTVLGYVQVEGNPALDGKEIISKEAWVEGQRAVETSAPTNLDGVITRVQYRAVLTLPRDAPPRPAKVEAHYQAAEQKITLSPTRVFLAPEKTIDVTATLSLPVSGTPKFTWKSNNNDVAKVTFAANNTDASTPNVVTITGGKREKAGTTKITVEYKSTTGVKAKTELEVNLVRVDFEQTADCTGFDDTKVQIPGTQNYEPFWLTAVLDGTATAPQPGTTAAQARAKITPASAASQVTFEVVDPTKATVSPAAATVSPQTISVLGQTHGETQLRALVNHEEAGILGLAVRRRVQLRVSFHFISDNAGHSQNRVSANNMQAATAHADAMVTAMNAILRPQTGIEYIRANVFFHQIQQNLTDVFSESNDVAVVTPFHDTDPNTNQDIYFVWELEKTETIPVAQPGQTVNRVVAAFVGAGGNNIFAENGADAQDLVHEALHAAVVRPTNPYPNDPAHSNVHREILYPTRNGTGCLIPKRDMDVFHSSF